MLRTPQPRQTHLTGAGFLLLLVLPSPVRADEKPRPKPPDRQAQAELRHYLPVLLQKTLLDNDRELVAEMDKLLQIYEVLLKGNIISVDKLEEAEKQLLEDRVRLLRRQTVYGDALDGYQSRFAVPAERLQQWEEGTLRPLLRHLQTFENLYEDWRNAREPLLRASTPKGAGKLRPLIEKAATSSKLVAGTQFRQRFPRSWKTWNKVKDANGSLQELITAREKLRRPERRQNREPEKLPPTPEFLPVPAALDQPQGEEQGKKKEAIQIPQRWEDVLFEIDVGMLEKDLRQYEEEPWKKEKNERGAFYRQTAAFWLVWRGISDLLCYPFTERVERLEKSWPALPPVRVEKVDLLTCKPERAEEVVTGKGKDKATALSARSKVRKVRAAAEIYALQQRAAALAFKHRENRRVELFDPRNPYDRDNLPGLQGAVLPRPKSPSQEAYLQLLDGQHALTRAKADILRSWLDYHQLRLELYQDLGLPPP